MRKHIFLLLLCLIGLIPLQAQTEESVIDTADAIVKRYYPTVGEPNRWSYNYTISTNDGSLGCPLVSSYDLGYSVIPWRVELTYPDVGTFVVYVAYRNGVQDITVPCFATTGTGGPTQQPQIEVQLVCNATGVIGKNVEIYSEPNNMGVYLGRLNDFAYLPVIGRNSDTGYYELSLFDTTGWVSIFDTNLSGTGCAVVPQTSSSISITDNFPDTSGVSNAGNTFACYLTATRANIRSAPYVGAPILGEIISGEVVSTISRTPGDDKWYQIQSSDGIGWVSSSVSTVTGSGCSALPQTSSTPTTNQDGQTFDVTPMPADNVCPAGFNGLLQPRLEAGQLGVVTFEILRVRTSPDARFDQANVIFEMPQGTTFSVINGPVCEETRIWWQIELNGVYGWVAESDSAVGYYVDPRQREGETRSLDTAEIARLNTGDQVRGMVFTPDGRLAVINGSDSTIRAWDMEQSVNQTLVPGINGQGVGYLAINPESDQSLTADSNNMLSLWQGEDLLYSMNTDFLPYFKTDVEASPHWTTAAASGCVEGSITGGCEESAVIMFDLSTGESVATLNVESVWRIAFSPDATQLITVGDSIYLWDISDLGNLSDPQQLGVDVADIQDVIFSPDGLTLAFIGRDAETDKLAVHLWDIETDTLVSVINIGSDVATVVYSPNGNTLAIGTADNQVVLWDVVMNTEVDRFSGYANGIASLAFDGEGNVLAAGDNAGNLVLLSVDIK